MKQKFQEWAFFIGVILVVALLIGGCNYADYTTYKRKFPNTKTADWVWDRIFHR